MGGLAGGLGIRRVVQLTIQTDGLTRASAHFGIQRHPGRVPREDQ
jgi:hypothetical protein